MQKLKVFRLLGVDSAKKNLINMFLKPESF